MRNGQNHHESKRKLLDAAFFVIRSKGYTATRVEDICEAAGVTKGSFFHHFKTKEDLALEAAAYWHSVTGELFRAAPYHAPADPLDRLLAYVEFRKTLLEGDLPNFTCLVGTMVQEIYSSWPAIRDACDASISGHVATLEPDIAAAIEKYGVTGDWTPESLALHTQSVIQGSFILAKAKGGATVAAESIDHLRRYIELLFGRTKSTAFTSNPHQEKQPMTTATLHETQQEAAILDVIAAMARARYEKDAEAIAATYAHDAAIYNLAPPLEHRGIDIAATQAWLDTWDGPITIEPRDFQVKIAGDTAVAYGYMRMQGTKIDPPAKPDFWMRETLVFERRGGTWIIVHEHTSVPFYMDASTRPAFDLQP